MEIIKRAYVFLNRNMKSFAVCWVGMCLLTGIIPATTPLVVGIVTALIIFFGIGCNSRLWKEVEDLFPPCEEV